MSISDLLNVSKMGLLSSQSALMTVSHNIANVNTAGYSRQTVEFQARSANKHSSIGNGVDIANVARSVDALVDKRIIAGSAEEGRLEARDRYLTIIENVFNEMDKDGLASRLDSFFSSMDGLADNPTNPVSRADTVAGAESLANHIQKMHQTLSETALPVDQEISGMIDDINTLLSNLKSLDATIVSREVTGPALDLKDQRHDLVSQLGSLIDISVLQMDNGGIQVFTSHGQKLLMDSQFSATLARSGQTTESGFAGIEINGTEFDTTDFVKGGKLKGLLEVRDEVIYGKEGVLTQLDALVDEIRFQTNVVSSQTVSETMYKSQTGVFDLGNDLNTAMNALIPYPELVKVGTPPVQVKGTAPADVLRVTAGTLTFAVGKDADHLKLESVEIDPSRTLQENMEEIDAISGLNATVDANNRLVLTADSGTQYGVVSDSSGFMAAMGIGAIFTGSGSSDMGVNEALIADPDQFGVAKLTVDDPTNPTKVTFNNADNRGALALGRVRERESKFTLDSYKGTQLGSEGTFSFYYATMVGLFGATVSRNSEALTTQQSAQSFLTDLRDSISGVSLEEELTELIRFQQSFQASSKMVSSADDLFQTIIGMV
ncbi:MAG: flagellar hook-associated protein FlgK [Magnetococcus sp. DMHC-6]